MNELDSLIKYIVLGEKSKQVKNLEGNLKFQRLTLVYNLRSDFMPPYTVHTSELNMYGGISAVCIGESRNRTNDPLPVCPSEVFFRMQTSNSKSVPNYSHL